MPFSFTFFKIFSVTHENGTVLYNILRSLRFCPFTIFLERQDRLDRRRPCNTYVLPITMVLLSAACRLLIVAALAQHHVAAFVVLPPLNNQARAPAAGVVRFSTLFADEPEMVEVVEHFVHAKYKQCIKEKGHSTMDKDDCREVLRTLLPPVTPEELEDEVDKTLAIILANPDNSADRINEDSFVKAIVKNSYWQAAGDLVVKELMYFDALYSYYQTGQSVLNNDDYESLKDDLTWEGSSVATLNKQEALFITAVASAKRGDPIMDDDEYRGLKKELFEQGSWVVRRSPDALEKLGMDTFLGYLHRALQKA